MKQNILTCVTVAVVMIAIASVGAYNNGLREEVDRLRANQEILLKEKESLTNEAQLYRVSDSLSAAKADQLELKLSEYKDCKAEDWALIRQLKSKGHDLQRVIDSQAESISNLALRLRDTVRHDTITQITDTIKCFNYTSKWTDVSGMIDLKDDSIELSINNRESLKVVETVKYKRFLGFLWKTSKVKERKVHVISLNPSTKIVNVEYIGVKP